MLATKLVSDGATGMTISPKSVHVKASGKESNIMLTVPQAQNSMIGIGFRYLMTVFRAFPFHMLSIHLF